MPNFTGVTPIARLRCGWAALNSAISARRAVQLGRGVDAVPDRPDPVRVADRLAVRRRLSLASRSCAAQLVGAQPEQRCTPAEDVLDHDHPLRAAEATERRIGGLVGLGDPSVAPDVRDPVRVVDVAQRRASTGSDRSRLQPPSAVERRLEAGDLAAVVEADPPLGVEAVPLAGHRQILGPVQAQPNRPAGDRRAKRGDRGETVRLHLLAAEGAAHPQALDGHLVAGPAQHVCDDVLGLRWVLGAGLDEDLAGLVDVGQGAWVSR